MNPTAIDARTLALVRHERAAGAAFGWDEEAIAVVRAGLAPLTALVLAAGATVLAATITYLA